MVASFDLEMKIRKDREVLLHFWSVSKMLILEEKDPVFELRDSLEQIRKTKR